MSSDGRCYNKILINERFAYNIVDVRTYREADCDSDHFLVVSSLKVKLKIIIKEKKSGIVRYDIDKVNDNRKCREFQGNVQRNTLKSRND